MKNSPVIISLFDGMSCGQIAISSFIKNYHYVASEVNLPAITVTQKNFPETTQVGDVKNIDTLSLETWKPFILMGGSPCKDFSIAGKKKGMEVHTLEDYLKLKNDNFPFQGQSYLFWEFVRVLKETKPKYFLLENTGLNKKYEKIINEVLGVKPIVINSKLVSGQNRRRLYWTNIPDVTIPEDKHIYLSDIVPNALGGYGRRGNWNEEKQNYTRRVGTTRKDRKSNCLLTSGITNCVTLSDGSFRYLTIEEREQLQTVPVGYLNVDGVSRKSKEEMLGNGWTIDVIKHIFSFIPEFQKLKMVG